MESCDGGLMVAVLRWWSYCSRQACSYHLAMLLAHAKISFYRHVTSTLLSMDGVEKRAFILSNCSALAACHFSVWP
jgi:hypothetical protein